MTVFVLTSELDVEFPRLIDADDVTNFIEVLVDALDAAGLEPDIGTRYTGTGPITVRLELRVDAPDTLTAQAVGAEALRRAIEAVPDTPSYSGVESSTRVLEPA